MNLLLGQFTGYKQGTHSAAGLITLKIIENFGCEGGWVLCLYSTLFMSEQSTSRQNFLIKAGTTVASVLSLGFLTKTTGSNFASSQKTFTVSSQLSAQPEGRAVARNSTR